MQKTLGNFSKNYEMGGRRAMEHRRGTPISFESEGRRTKENVHIVLSLLS